MYFSPGAKALLLLSKGGAEGSILLFVGPISDLSNNREGVERSEKGRRDSRVDRALWLSDRLTAAAERT